MSHITPSCPALPSTVRAADDFEVIQSRSGWRHTPEDPHDRQRLDAHMSRVMKSPENTNRAITWKGDLVGSIASFVVEGQTEVTYWVDRAVWGRGIASQALALFLEVVRTRPLKARIASDNAGSLRVLEKAGFTIIDIEVSFAPGRGTGIEETILRLG